MEKESATVVECTTEPFTGKLHELLTDSDDETSEFCFEEETIEEVMKEFYKEIIACPKQPPSTTTSLPLKEKIPPVVGAVEEYKMEEDEDEEGDFDEEWLARVLNWGQGKVGDTNQWF